MTRENLINKIKKLTALANQGYGGEKEAAAVILNRLMEKHGITDADLEEAIMERRWFRYKDELQKKLLHQILYMVLGNRPTYRYTNTRKQNGADCTAEEYMEIEFLYDFYTKALKEELVTFMRAFYFKNSIFPPKEVQEADTETQTLNEEEYLKACQMMQGMEKHDPRKVLEG